MVIADYLPLMLALAAALFVWPQSTRSALIVGDQSPVVRPRDGPPEPSLWAKALRGSRDSAELLDRASELRLLSACLTAGLSPATAAEAVASTTEVMAWSRLATMLAVGVPSQAAWAELALVPGLEEIAVVARNASRSGAAMSAGCARIAQQLEQQAQDAAVARAEKAGVMIAAPLSLCFLPAFIVLGLVPLIFNLGLTVL